MKRIAAIMACAVTVAFSGAGWAVAQEPVSENDLVTGARALGMGNAQIGAADDVTSVISNPAALTRIRDLQFQFGVDVLRKTTETQLSSDTATGSGSADESYFGLGTLGFAYPVPTDRGHLVFGFGLNRVKDFTGKFYMDGFDANAFQDDLNGDGSIDPSEIWEGSRTDEILESGGLYVASFAGAVDISPQVSVGASIDIWTGNYTSDERVLRNNHDTGDSWLDVIRRDDDITAVSFKPSILYSNGLVHAGATLRLPMTYHVDYTYRLDPYSRYQDGYYMLHSTVSPASEGDNYYADGAVYDSYSYTIKAPLQLGFGLTLGEPGLRSVAVDMVYENWKDGKDKDFPYYFSDKYRRTISWRVGAEHDIPGTGIVGRVGYMREPVRFTGPREDYSGAPVVEVENERDYLTLGFSAMLDPGITLDVGYAHGFWRTREGFRQDKETKDWVMASLTYRMPMLYW